MTRLGYQIANFTYPGVGPDTLFATVAAQARAAEDAGFDTVLVMDHFYQLANLGPPDAYMLEAYTLLGALAPCTSRVRLGTLVTGNTYRNPAMLAKVVTTLDVVSAGRALLGIGAGWYELEHDAFGFAFGTFGERFDKLAEALAVITPMLRGEPANLDGRHYRVVDAINSPPPVGRIPVTIGGGGERRTLRLVAAHADASNLISEPHHVPRKLDALARHCAELGRDRSEITVSWHRPVCIAPTTAQAHAELATHLRRRGIDLAALARDEQDAIVGRYLVGDPDTVGERLAADLALGVDGFTLNAAANGYLPERVELLGRTAVAVLGPATA